MLKTLIILQVIGIPGTAPGARWSNPVFLRQQRRSFRFDPWPRQRKWGTRKSRTGL